jgi:hypothetical protein
MFVVLKVFKYSKMELQEARKFLKRGDQRLLSKKLSCSPALVQDVLRGHSKSELVKQAVIQLARLRMNEAARAVEDVLKEN